MADMRLCSGIEFSATPSPSPPLRPTNGSLPLPLPRSPPRPDPFSTAAAALCVCTLLFTFSLSYFPIEFFESEIYSASAVLNKYAEVLIHNSIISVFISSAYKDVLFVYIC